MLRAVVFAVVVLVLSPLSAPAHSAPPGKPVTVMSRNLYLGADIQRRSNAAVAAKLAGATQQDILVALANATHVSRAIVDQTNSRCAASSSRPRSPRPRVY